MEAIKQIKTTTNKWNHPTHKQGNLTSHPKYPNKTLQLYQTNRKENQEAHGAKQHNHNQSNQET